MSGELAFLRFAKVPTEDRQTCSHAVSRICNNDCTFDEIQDLMSRYSCHLDQLVGCIVRDLRRSVSKRKG
jgi:hypothetical protein